MASNEGPDLWVGGSFFTIGVSTNGKLARWTGTQWDLSTTPVLQPFSANIRTILVTNGMVYIGGTFTNVAGTNASRLADRAILTTSYEGSPRLWDAENGRLLHILPHDGGVYRAVEGRKSARAVTGSWDGTARVWNLNSGLPAAYPHLIHGGPALALDFDDENNRVLTGSFDGTVRLYSLNRGLPVVFRARSIGSPLSAARTAALGAGRTKRRAHRFRHGQMLSPWLPHDANLRAFGITTNAALLATLTTNPAIPANHSSRVFPLSKGDW